MSIRDIDIPEMRYYNEDNNIRSKPMIKKSFILSFVITALCLTACGETAPDTPVQTESETVNTEIKTEAQTEASSAEETSASVTQKTEITSAETSAAEDTTSQTASVTVSEEKAEETTSEKKAEGTTSGKRAEETTVSVKSTDKPVIQTTVSTTAAVTVTVEDIPFIAEYDDDYDDYDDYVYVGEEDEEILGADPDTWRSYSDEYEICPGVWVSVSLFDDCTGYAVYDEDYCRIGSLVNDTGTALDQWNVILDDIDGDGVNELGTVLENGETLWFAYDEDGVWSESNTGGCFVRVKKTED